MSNVCFKIGEGRNYSLKVEGSPYDIKMIDDKGN